MPNFAPAMSSCLTVLVREITCGMMMCWKLADGGKVTNFCLLLVADDISKKLELEPDMAKVRRALNIAQKFREWRWLLSEYREEDGGLPPAEDVERWKAEVKSPRTQATSSRARNASPLRKKPKLPSAKKIPVGVVPASSAKLGDHDLLREVVRARSSSPVERQRDADVPPRSSGRLHQSKSGGRCGRSAHLSNRHDPIVESRAVKRGVDST
ncbi:unnamed protein product [Prunus armeniaca]